MYCYECESSGEYSTISTQNVSSYPISRYAKKGNGYVKITYMGDKNDSSFQNELGDSFVYSYKEENGSGVEQTFTVPVTGVYRLEVWGGQGGSYSSYLGGTGGYSVGEIELQKDRTLYINGGGAGDSLTTVGSGYLYGGYNGGGYGYSGDSYNYVTGGGGATHIAFATGLLTAFDPTLENSIHNQLIIVAGGGGSAFYHTNGRYGHGGHGGGYIGSSGTTNTSATLPTGGTQSSGGLGDGSGTFGKGADSGWGNGGGGGYYGGGAAVTGTPNVAYNYTGAGGGSGYIGNNALSNKHMYCYNCTTSSATNENTYTISDGTNSCKNQSPVANCAKQGNGFARITLIEIK